MSAPQIKSCAAGKSKLLAGWAKRLTNLRLRLDMSPDEMAGTLGMSEAAYMAYEHNERSENGPGWHDLLYRLAIHDSKVSLNWIVLGQHGTTGRCQSRRPIDRAGRPIPKGYPQPPTFAEMQAERRAKLEGQAAELHHQPEASGLELRRLNRVLVRASIGNVIYPGCWHGHGERARP